MNTEVEHTPPPQLPTEIYVMLSKQAEEIPDAKLVVMFVPDAQATISAITEDGVVQSWTVLTPTSEDGTRAFLAGEVERGMVAEADVVFLHMGEVTIN